MAGQDSRSAEHFFVTTREENEKSHARNENKEMTDRFNVEVLGGEL